MKKFLLVAVNAKYIHSNLALYSLKAFAQAKGVESELAEYTINHQMETVLRDIYLRKPDVIGFSCYIWNMSFITELAEEVHKVLPQVPIWLGGPEVTWNPETRLEEMPFIKGIMVGEGEQTFTELAEYYMKTLEEESAVSDLADAQGMAVDESGLCHIPGLCLRDETGKGYRTAQRALLPMDELVFPYENLASYKNRIIYYESGRGCPFSCSYCLSSVEKKLRFRRLSLVFEELAVFLREKVAQVKFVDRTFNCSHNHAYSIWKYILENDNGVTNFHFEISADLLKEEDFELFRQMRPGLIQLEIGVQTTNPQTIKAINRKMDLEKLAYNTERVRKERNIHQHLDLIAGLPWEDLESFGKSFNDVYDMHPDQLQLGFLKVLHGTEMEKRAKEYGLVYRSNPVYEVLNTKWISYEDILVLKSVEETVEEYYNSGQFSLTLAEVVPYFESPFAFYREFGMFLHEQGYRDASQNRVERYMALRNFLIGRNVLDVSQIDELLSFDFCLREKLNRIPAFIPNQDPWKKAVSDFFAQEIKDGRWFGKEAAELSYRQLRGRCQPLVLSKNLRKIYDKFNTHTAADDDIIETMHWLVLFDYEQRDVMNHNARVIWVPIAAEEGEEIVWQML